MAIETILAQIDSEIARLKQARNLLATTGTAATKAGRSSKKASAKAKPRKKRVLSAEARKRIADAQRKRWAAVRAKAKQKG
jgi:topoisomerase IA-like protein